MPPPTSSTSSASSASPAMARSHILVAGEVIRTEEEESLPDDEVVRRALSSYEPIEKSIYIDGKVPRVDKGQMIACQCHYAPGDPLSNACGENCLNRMSNVECDKDKCPCKNRCTNRRLQMKDYAAVEVFRTPKKGCGLRTLMDLPKGALVMEYCGEVLPLARFQKRTKQYTSKGMRHFYFMTLDADTVIDATRKGAISRFINHSCGPNCETQKWTVDGVQRIGLFTTQPVAKGEEITFDYKFKWFPGAKAQRCFCGSPKCTGYIGQVKQGTALAESTDNGADEKADSEAELAEGERSADEEQPSPGSDDMDVDVDKEAVPADDDGVYAGGQGLKGNDAVHALIEKLLDTKNQDTVLHALHQLGLTDDPGSLKTFVSDLGLEALRAALEPHASNPTLVMAFLEVLGHLPPLNRATVDKAKLEPFLRKVATLHSGDEVVTNLVERRLANWDAMHNAYKIRKHQGTDGEAPAGAATAGAAATAATAGAATGVSSAGLGSMPTTPSSVSRVQSSEAAPRHSPLFGSLDRFQSSSKFTAVAVPSAPLRRFTPVEEPERRASSAGDDDAAHRKRPAADAAAADTAGAAQAAAALAPVAKPEPLVPVALPADPTLAAAPVLPEGWFASTDAYGNTYYYHAATRVTQWEFPQASYGAAPPPPPAPAPADAAPEVPDKSDANYKFRDELAKHVVHVLAKWKRDLDVDVFKQTARKLTHAIEEKEQKANPGPLSLTEDIKKKAGKYVVSHMTKNLDVLRRSAKAGASAAAKQNAGSHASSSSRKPGSSSKHHAKSASSASKSAGRPAAEPTPASNETAPGADAPPLMP